MSPSDLNNLRARIARIQESGVPTASEALFDLATQKPPSIMLRDFFSTASPPVQQAMQDAITSLLGALPPFEFDSQITTTGDKLAALMLQLQMTGYMLRNAEYVVTVRQLLGLRTRSAAEYRKAFEKLDLDGSGSIETAEVEALLRSVYGGEEPPAFEVETMMRLFDTNNDGSISWEEFATALGADMSNLDAEAPVDGSSSLPAAPDEDAPALPSPQLEGTVKVDLDNGEQVEIDASAYMEELKAEAQALRAELAKVQNEEAQRDAALSQSISAYVSSLPEPQLKLLISGISEDVQSAMRLLVEYILKAPGGGTPGRARTRASHRARVQSKCAHRSGANEGCEAYARAASAV